MTRTQYQEATGVVKKHVVYSGAQDFKVIPTNLGNERQSGESGVVGNRYLSCLVTLAALRGKERVCQGERGGKGEKKEERGKQRQRHSSYKREKYEKLTSICYKKWKGWKVEYKVFKEKKEKPDIKRYEKKRLGFLKKREKRRILQRTYENIYSYCLLLFYIIYRQSVISGYRYSCPINFTHILYTYKDIKDSNIDTYKYTHLS